MGDVIDAREAFDDARTGTTVRTSPLVVTGVACVTTGPNKGDVVLLTQQQGEPFGLRLKIGNAESLRDALVGLLGLPDDLLDASDDEAG